ncbi:MAG: alkaline phosphatase [bacterium]|jgi:alkaline phosphatase
MKKTLPAVLLTTLLSLAICVPGIAGDSGAWAAAGSSSGTDGSIGAGAPARSMILFIGDGMGVQITSIALLVAEKERGAPLNMTRLANQGAAGLVSTYSADRLVTDSAASGTALATGVMTNNGVVGMAPDGGILQNLFEIAVWEGKAVGVVTTTSVTDATPASFLAHVRSREEHENIAAQIVEGSANVVLGGGRMFFQPPPEGKRSDGRDLVETARERGFQVVFTAGELEVAARSESVGQGRLLGLFSRDVMPFELDRDKAQVPSVADMMSRAIDFLDDDPDGFVLVVEGGRIDHAEHENSIEDALADLFAFDEAIGRAMTYQEADSTMAIVVTADHECGGPAITGTSYSYPHYGALDKIDEGDSEFLQWISGHHTATMVPVFASGPGARRFTGVMHNTELHARLAWLLGF